MKTLQAKKKSFIFNKKISFTNKPSCLIALYHTLYLKKKEAQKRKKKKEKRKGKGKVVEEKEQKKEK